MNPSTIEIHEFSTGIRPQQTADGGWVSLGFTGQYMNVTIERIPEAVERSIANREFAVAEGASSDKPAIIGRVLGTGEDIWSVVAIVTRGRDEKGRSASMYRYLLSNGSDGYKNLRLILAWWEDQETPLTFNPFDIRELGKPNICDVALVSTRFRPQPQEATKINVDIPEPILLSPEQQYDLQTINTLASKKYKANKNGQALSWAFNVEALEKPERFQVIQAASTRAYQILQKAIANTPKVLAPVVTDEEALKSAIRGLMNSSQVKPENVKVIADALANDQITSAYWHTLFDAQGARTAIEQKIYSPQMVRLITLRAMVIPETILKFLVWLNIKSGQKPDDNQTISLEFQKAIRSYLPKEKLADSIKFLLPKLLNQPQEITPEYIHWLLVEKGSAWESCRKEFINDILYDLQLISDHFKTANTKSNLPSQLLKCPIETWKLLISNWSPVYSGYYKLKQYNYIAWLFEQLGENLLAGYFYQISQGIVPKEVFDKIAVKQTNTSEPVVFDLNLKRDVSFVEGIIYFLFQEFIVPIQIVILLSILIFFSGLLVGSKVFPETISESKTDNNIPSNNTSIKSSQGSTGYIDEALIKKATNKQNFDKTNNSIETIVKDINNKNNFINREEIIAAIQSVLNVNIDYDKAVREEKSDERKKIVRAIYNYQNSYIFSRDPDGILGQETIRALETKVKTTLSNSHQKTIK
ncbi:hypothetical protein NIES37_38010 [Tolypothrix tenuis PCC 7101]|uniref:Uncharacterized protein n=1 Tax=Tolypothrix tenuis PCC 7101 TaxID=231146 RepID=A0A1Z4N240_9CYAN|nr:hypothetical protein [Aulosira sp. FACHB-113]BAY99818.1 hypothetical protein NIES37_38010 [Tolypothrix tenuis PCC 7101]BAZ76260.1 hypothetical protein NIES50_48580 [Aulosira laxa NIES-50]